MDTFFKQRQEGADTVIEFVTESLMNPLEVDRISQGLHTASDQPRPHMVLDFNRVRYLSSPAIGMLLSLRKKVAAIEGGTLVLSGVGPELMQLLKITNLHRAFTIRPK